MAQQDYYKTLGVGREAGEEEIRKAYRRLARKHHPDLNPGDKASEDRFKKVQEAYDILSDSKKKQMYDQFGFYSENGAPGTGPGGAQRGPNMGFGGFDFSEAFMRGAAGSGAGRGRPSAAETGGASGFHDIFSQWFGHQQESAGTVPEKGTDLEYGLSIDFWQAIKGTQVRLNIAHQEVCATCGVSLTCPKCEGTGRLRNRCATCQGDGRISAQETVEVRIPPGAQQGSRLRVAGKGNAGTQGAPPGDLYITVRVDPHPFFRRDGDDIEITVPVRIDEAGLGTKIEVPTIDGRALLKIPQGTKNGQKFRLRDRGVPNSRTGKRGDEIVEVAIDAPQVKDERTKELLREYAQLHPEDPRAEIWTKV